MKNTLLSLLSLVLFCSAAFAQNSKMIKFDKERGPNGGVIQIIDEAYTVEMKRNAGSINLFVSDNQGKLLKSDNDLSGAVTVSYTDKTEETFVIEPGLDLSDIALKSENEIYMVMLWAKHNGEHFEARYYLKEGRLWDDYDQRMKELKDHEAETAE